jgi:hypothetical protein
MWRRITLGVTVPLLTLVTSCGGSKDECAVEEDEKACGWDDARLKTCAISNSDSRLYGRAKISFVNYRGPDPGLMCGTIDITATPKGGGTAHSTKSKNGLYSLALPPGSFEVCANQPEARQACVTVEIAPGRAQQVDSTETRSVGGIYLTLTAK